MSHSLRVLLTTFVFINFHVHVDRIDEWKFFVEELPYQCLCQITRPEDGSSPVMHLYCGTTEEHG